MLQVAGVKYCLFQMLWCVAIVAAVVSAVQGQITRYDGTTFVSGDDDVVIVNAPSSAPAPAPAFGQSFGPSLTFVPAPAPVQPVVIAQQPTFLPPPQQSFIPVTAPAGTQFGIPQGGLPVLPACPTTHSLVSGC